MRAGISQELCLPPCKRLIKRDEQGAGALLAFAVLAFLGAFAALAVNVAQYYEQKSHCVALAHQTAAYAASYLPDIEAARAAAESAFAVLSKNVQTGESFSGNLAMSVFVDYFDDTTDAIVRKAFSSGDSAPLPVKSLVIQVEDTYDLWLPALAGVEDTLSVVNLQAHATAQLVPTDVVLVIEDSNSVVSGTADDSEPTSIATAGHPFAPWGNEALGRGRSGGTAYGADADNPPSLLKATARARQCFAKVHRDIKTAALTLFDYLSASATYRVGLFYTTNTTGEFPAPTLNITADSYQRPYQRNDFNTAEETNYFAKVMGNTEYGAAEYPETRCAALARSGAGEFYRPVPDHPLKSWITAAWYAARMKSDLSSLLQCDGLSNDNNCTELSHLDFDYTNGATLLPRELLWAHSAGRSFASGLLNPKYDYAQMQFALLRAHDMLRDAPQREDKLPVRRKVIIVFTDGFETPFASARSFGLESKANDQQFHRARNATESGASATVDEFLNPASPPAETNYNTLFDDYCAQPTAPKENPIYSSTEVSGTAANNTTGVKLGFVYYGGRGFTAAEESNDPFRFAAHLSGHGYSSSELTSRRSSCNTKWSATRGRFIVETNDDATDDGTELSTDIIPKVLRSLTVSEVIDSRRPTS